MLVWNLEKGDVVRQLIGHTGHVTAVSVTADGSTVVSGMFYLNLFHKFDAVAACIKFETKNR